MKHTERQHLKENDLALALARTQGWAHKNSKTLFATLAVIVLLGGGVLAYNAWRSSADNRARVALAEAMVIEEARVMPPAPPAGTTNDPNALGCGFVPVRKPGKLPGATHKEAYSLEYGENALEIHQDACGNQQRIVIVDDVLATGGTAKATVDLTRKAGGKIIGVAFLIELDFLNGRSKLPGEPVYSVLRY